MPRQPHLDHVACVYATDVQHRPHCELTAVVRYGTITVCGDCDARRSTLGKAQPPRPLPPQTPLDLLNWIAHSDQRMQQAHLELHAAVHRARQRGHSWQTIGSTLNITRQAAQQRFKQDQPPRG